VDVRRGDAASQVEDLDALVLPAPRPARLSGRQFEAAAV
jgi:hypothetical protein